MEVVLFSLKLDFKENGSQLFFWGWISLGSDSI